MRSYRPKSALPQHLLEYLTLLQRQTHEHAPIVRLALAHSYVEQAQGKRHTEVATVGYAGYKRANISPYPRSQSRQSTVIPASSPVTRLLGVMQNTPLPSPTAAQS